MRRLFAIAIVAPLLLSAPFAHADGKALYDKMCKSCHGADGKGEAKKATALKVDQAKLVLGSSKKTTADIKAVILKGENKMPAYEKKLSAGTDADDVVSYVESLIKAMK